MKNFVSEKVGRTFIIRLEKGDLLRESIEELSMKENIKNAVVISGIATFDKAQLQMTTTYGFPIEYFVHTLEEPLELASLDGTIIDFKPHIHGVIGNADHSWAGHILDGCRILYLAEIVIQELICQDLKRKPNENGVYLISDTEDLNSIYS
jgi:Predicted DNA-binding protein with PD1-like DNA-binding motif